MAARDVIVASVRDFLGEIQQLQVEKDGLDMVNPTKATYLQSQIWRKFCIAESLMESCLEAKEVLEQEVSLKRKEFKAEAEDLEATPVPKAVEAKAVQGWADAEEGRRVEPFPYLQLPPEVRKVILSFLTTATDQLNFGQVVREDWLMMNWDRDEDAVRFQKVLSILFSRQMLEHQDVRNLILAGDYMQEGISKWFENYLKDSFIDTKLRDYYEFAVDEKQLEDLTQDDFALNPMPVRIQLDDRDIDDDDEDRVDAALKQSRNLREMGHKIWHCCISIERSSAEQLITQLRDHLALIPNVKYLELDLSHEDDDEEPEDIGYFDEVELPDLPNLQGLKIDQFECSSLVIKLLTKYRDCVSQLRIPLHFPLVPERGEGPYPQLAALYIDERWTGSLMNCQRWPKFPGSPLKFLRLRISSERKNPALLFQSLVDCVAQFGTTLEELDLKIKNEHLAGEVTDFSWLARVQLPKVKSLTIRGRPNSVTFLLHLPALETLSWEYNCNSRKRMDDFVASKYFRLSLNKVEMRNSALWKMLPHLKSVEVRRHQHGGNRRVTHFRSESLAYQQKQKAGRSKRKTQEELKAENKDWGTRKSARIVNMQQK